MESKIFYVRLPGDLNERFRQTAKTLCVKAPELFRAALALGLRDLAEKPKAKPKTGEVNQA